MPTPTRFLEHPPLRALDLESPSEWYDGAVDFPKLAVGDLCYYHHRGVPCRDAEHLAKLRLSAPYYAHNAGRPPLILALPDKPTGTLYFLVVRQRCNRGKGYHEGWTASGVPPRLTV